MEEKLIINVGDWVIDVVDNIVKVTHDDMPELPYENIIRLAEKQDFIERGVTIPEEMLEWRMYFFVPHLYLSDKQIGIQSGHCALRYALDAYKYDDNPQVWEFIEDHETFIILGAYDSPNMEIIREELEESGIKFAAFNEPGINEALTALCFLVDERVFDWKTYPPYHKYRAERAEGFTEGFDLDFDEIYPEDAVDCDEYVDFVGGTKNVILKGLIYGKNLA